MLNSIRLYQIEELLAERINKPGPCQALIRGYQTRVIHNGRGRDQPVCGIFANLFAKVYR